MMQNGERRHAPRHRIYFPSQLVWRHGGLAFDCTGIYSRHALHQHQENPNILNNRAVSEPSIANEKAMHKIQRDLYTVRLS